MGVPTKNVRTHSWTRIFLLKKNVRLRESLDVTLKKLDSLEDAEIDVSYTLDPTEK